MGFATFSLDDTKKRLTIAAISTISFVYAENYAVIKTDPINDSELNLTFAQDLSGLNIPYKVVTLETPASITTTTISLNSLSANDSLLIHTELPSFSTLFPSATQDDSFSVSIQLDQNSVFNSHMAVSQDVDVSFVINGHELLLSEDASITGSGDLFFNEGSASGQIIAHADLSGFTGSLAINGSNIVSFEEDVTLSGVLAGQGKIIKKGPLTTRFQNSANTFDGDIEIQQGVLELSSSEGMGLLLADGTTVTLVGGSKTLKSLQTENVIPNHPVVAQIGVVTINNTEKNVFGGTLQNTPGITGMLTKTGPGELVLQQTNSYGSSTTVNEGRLTFGANNSIGLGHLIIAGGTVDLNGKRLDISGSSLVLVQHGTLLNSNINQAAINNRSIGFGLQGPAIIGGDGDIIQYGTFFRTAWQPLTKIGSGKLCLFGPMSINTSNVEISDGSIVIGNDSSEVTLNSTLLGAGTLEKVGLGTLNLPRSSPDFTGNILITAGKIEIGAPKTGVAPAGDQTVVSSISGPGTLEKTQSNDILLRGDMSAHTGIFDIKEGRIIFGHNGADQIIASELRSTSQGHITKTGTNKVTLTGDLSALNSSSFIRIAQGILAVGNNHTNQALSNDLRNSMTIPPTEGIFEKVGSNTLTLLDLGRCDIGFMLTDGVLDIRPLSNLNIRTSFAGGAGSLRKSGPAALTISGTGANTYTGDTEVVEGTLQAGKHDAFGTGAIRVFPGATLVINSRNLNSNSAIFLNGGFLENNIPNQFGGFAKPVTLLSSSTIQGSGGILLSGPVISDEGSVLTKNGAGQLSLQDIAQLMGGINITEGEVEIIAFEDTVLNSDIIGPGNLKILGQSNEITLAGDFTEHTGSLIISPGAYVIMPPSKTLNIIDAQQYSRVSFEQGVGLPAHHVQHINLNNNSLMVIEPDVEAVATDEAVIVLENTFTIGADAGINIHARGSHQTLEPYMVKVLQLSPGLNNEITKTAILNVLSSDPNESDYDFISASFSEEGLLTAEVQSFLSRQVLSLLPGYIMNLTGKTLNNQEIRLQGATIQNFAGGSTTLNGALAIVEDSIVQANGSMTVIGPLTSNATLVKEGAGPIVFASSANTYGGLIDIREGTVELQSAQPFFLDSRTYLPQVLMSEGSILTLGGDEQTILQFKSIQTQGSYLSQVPVINMGSGLIVINPENLEDAIILEALLQDADLDTPGRLKKTGRGSLQLEHTSTYTGYTEAQSGTLVFAADNALGSGDLLISTGPGSLGIVDLNGYDNYLPEGKIIKTYGGRLINSNTNSRSECHATFDFSTGLTIGGNGDILLTGSAGGLLNLPTEFDEYVEERPGFLITTGEEGALYIQGDLISDLPGLMANSAVFIGDDEPVRTMTGNLLGYGFIEKIGSGLITIGRPGDLLAGGPALNKPLPYLKVSEGSLSFAPGTYADSVEVKSNGSLVLNKTSDDLGISLSVILARPESKIYISISKSEGSNSNPIQANCIFDEGVELILQPDLRSNELDSELLLIPGVLFLPDNLDSFFVTIEPLDNGARPSNKRLNLLRLGSEGINTEQNRSRILSCLRVSEPYLLHDVRFSSEGLLSVLLRSTLSIPVTEELIEQKIPQSYQGFLRQILLKQSAQGSSSSLVYDSIINAASEADLIANVRAFTPTGALPSALYQPVGDSGFRNMAHFQRQQITLSRFVQGVSAGQQPVLVQKIAALDSHQQNKLMRYAESEIGGLQLESFRHLNFEGWSFESQIQYQYQHEPNRSEEEIGYSSHSWTTTLGTSYSKKNHYSIGAVIGTTKTREKMNTNTIDKGGNKTDRQNTIGLLGYYHFNTLPITISGLATYGQHNYEQIREWLQPIDELEQLQAQAGYKAYEVASQLELGYLYHYSEVCFVQPFIGGTWSSTHNAAYEEKSQNIQSGLENSYGYIVPEQSYSSALYSLGLEVIGMRHINDTESLFFVRVGVSTQKNNGENSTFRYAVAIDPSAVLEMSYPNHRYNTADMMLGFYTMLTQNMTLTGLYQAHIGKHVKTQSVSVALDYSF